MRYVFMGSPDFAVTVLSDLVDQVGPPVLIFTQPPKAQGRGKTIVPTAIEIWARSKSLAVTAVSNINDPQVVSKIKGVDVAIVAAFGQILKEEILKTPRLGCFNIHASLLPKYRGAAPIQRAIQNGDTETGITIQRIVRKLDAGDILLQKTCAIELQDTSIELFERLAKLGRTACVEALKLLEAGKAKFIPQDESKVTYAAKIEKEEAWIDWTKNAKKVEDQIKAFQPWPIAQTKWDNTVLKVFKAETGRGFSGSPGEIKTDRRTSLCVQCGEDSALFLKEVQLENRKRLAVNIFLQGQKKLPSHF